MSVVENMLYRKISYVLGVMHGAVSNILESPEEEWKDQLIKLKSFADENITKFFDLPYDPS